MGCCNMISPALSCIPKFDMAEETLKLSTMLTGDTRKAIKLLSKQYEIDSIRKDPPEYSDDRIVREMPLVITYFSWERPEVKFEWTINLNEFKNGY